MKNAVLETHSREETLSLAARLARVLKGGEIIFLHGPIGAGKTVFVKGVAAALQLKSSPTSASFSLLKEYRNRCVRLFHIDLFRLEKNEVFNLGLEEILADEQAILLAEWPDPAAALFPSDRLEMNFILQAGDRRKIELISHGPVSERLREALCPMH